MSIACGRPSNDKNAGDGREPRSASSNVTVADSPPNICSHSSGPQTRKLTTCTTNRGNSSLPSSPPSHRDHSGPRNSRCKPPSQSPQQQSLRSNNNNPRSSRRSSKRAPPQPETWPQAVTEHQQGAAGDDETEGAIRAESQGPGRCLRSNLSGQT